MNMLIVSVRDEVSGQFSVLNLEQSEATAVRNFRYALRKAQEEKNGLLYASPSDFALYCLGSFDPSTGNITTVVPGVLLRGDGNSE